MGFMAALGTTQSALPTASATESGAAATEDAYHCSDYFGH